MAYDRIGNLKGSTPDDTKLRALIGPMTPERDVWRVQA